MGGGWTTVGELKPGDRFETRNGELWTVLEPGPTGAVRILRDWHLSDDAVAAEPDLPARRVGTFSVAPDIDPTLRGLLVAALAGGDPRPVADYVLERLGRNSGPPGDTPDPTARDPRLHVCLLCGAYPVEDPDRCECLTTNSRHR